MRVACSTDPLDPVIRPRRLALAPRAAMVFGALLLVLGLGLALRAVLTVPDGASGAAPPTATGLPAAAVDPAATGPPGSAAAPGPADPAATGPPDPADPAGAPAGRIVVHVVGAVVSPGVVVLADGARVADAIAAAGGAASDADTEQLNLARVLSDGEQIRVPRVGEVLPDPAPPPTGAAGPGARTASGKPGDGGASGTVNINTASASELEKLPGIGPALAQRIVEYRDSHGPFASVDALTDVPGIGKAKLEALREQATV